MNQVLVVTDDIEGYLRAELELVRTMLGGNKINGYASVTDFVIRHGRKFNPWQTSRRFRGVGRKRECFNNALHLAVEHEELVYVEGYYMCGALPVPLPHAWCLDRKGRVIEPTIPGDVRVFAYFGVPLRTLFAAEIAELTGKAGALDVPELRWPVLRAEPEDWQVAA